MKNIIRFAAISLVALIALSSCKKDDNPVDEPKLTVTQPEEVAIEGGETTFKVTSNTTWTITGAEEWIEVVGSGEGEQTVIVTVAENTGEARSNKLTVTEDGGATKDVTVKQAGVAAPFITAATASAPAEGGAVKFSVASNVAWSIASNDAWITSPTPASGENTLDVTVTVAENTGNARIGTLTVTGPDGLTATMTINQAGVGEPNSLVDALVGTWTTSGFRIYGTQTGATAEADTHTVTIEKIDDTSVRIIDIIGMVEYYDFETSEADTFIATVNNENRTISIPCQAIEPSIDMDGWPTKLFALTQKDMADCWEQETGFIDIPVAEDMTINFGAHGANVGDIDGTPINGTFAVLCKDPTGMDTNTYYIFYSADTVWTKDGGATATASASATNNVYNFTPSMNFGKYSRGEF